MLILLSPAKSLDYDTPVAADLPHTGAQFLPQASTLIALLQQKSPQELAMLMKISDPLAALNVARYQTWTLDDHGAAARPALLAFNGAVYEGLQARSLSRADLDWAQQHLAILSGLYGVLRPLDAMRPYRLEMGTRLATPQGQNLYQFWGTQIAEYLNAQLHAPIHAGTVPVVLNLASQEYFKAIHRQVLQARVVECVFEDYHSGAYKIISVHAKRARGLMARYCIVQRATAPQQLESFNAEGYAFDASASKPERLLFRRRTA
ncbi:peroxide stress protein YaaA [Simplicispira psychrophila]|uniref:peroxide stress protein YaaA n=1 Tax=Simplicispira psychrophila TaxID=80882 RepID=UPI0004843B61|nr:peroxide stress protein YaaA [Simplicispira psychrophila]